ncbi:MAG TPA: protein translocase subunit SecD, partial [Pseudomonadales bacterium]
MARSPGLVGESLLGLSRPTSRPPNTNTLGRSVMVILAIVLGALYSAPNLFLPDPALQIRSSDAQFAVDDAVLRRAAEALERAGITVIGQEHDGQTALIRLADDDQQLRGRDVVSAALNPGADRRFVVALNRAPTTPEWLQRIGGKPVNLGLDLSGGVHFLLEVDMDKFLADRMKRNAQAIRNLLVENRLRYASTDWQRGQTLAIPFQSEEIRAEARRLIEVQFDEFEIVEQPVGGQPGLVLTIAPQTVTQLEDLAISQNLTSLRNRVNELGVAEPLVQRLGRTRIVLDLPGVQ